MKAEAIVIETTDSLTAILESLKAYSGTARLSEPSDVAAKYIGLRQIGKLADELKAGMQEEVRQFLSDGELLEVGGEYITLQPGAERKTCDWRALVKAHPEIEETVLAFVVTTKPADSVVVKVKEASK